MLLNMLMVSIVVITAFAVIFVLTYTREQESNRAKLYSGFIPHMTLAGRPFIDESASFGFQPGGPYVMSGFARRIIPGAGVSFSLLVDSSGSVIQVNSMVDLPEAVYEKAALEALSSKNGMTVELEGRSWQYAVSSVTVEFFESTNVAYMVSGAYRDIRFLDVTDSNRMLWSLGLTLSGLTVIILAAFFFISRFFANRAIQPMEEAFEKQNRFVADASHELKTPLSIISANCDVLYAGKDETVDSQIRWVDSIKRATGRMTGLVGDLLTLARMEDKEHELQLNTFDLSETVSEAVYQFQPAALNKGLSIEKQIEPGLEIKSDRSGILKILAVLIDNAIKYTQEDGEISVTLQKEKRAVTCTVRNSGGISPEELPRVFDRFYRGDPARAHDNGGYGLGLAIAKATAERLGAELTVTSEPELYTEFHLIFNM